MWQTITFRNFFEQTKRRSKRLLIIADRLEREINCCVLYQQVLQQPTAGLRHLLCNYVNLQPEKCNMWRLKMGHSFFLGWNEHEFCRHNLKSLNGYSKTHIQSICCVFWAQQIWLTWWCFPYQPFLVKLIPSGSQVGFMLMQTLVWTGNQHELVITRSTFFKLSNRTFLKVLAGLNELTKVPGDSYWLDIPVGIIWDCWFRHISCFPFTFEKIVLPHFLH